MTIDRCLFSDKMEFHGHLKSHFLTRLIGPKLILNPPPPKCSMRHNWMFYVTRVLRPNMSEVCTSTLMHQNRHFPDTMWHQYLRIDRWMKSKIKISVITQSNDIFIQFLEQKWQINQSGRQIYKFCNYSSWNLIHGQFTSRNQIKAVTFEFFLNCQIWHFCHSCTNLTSQGFRISKKKLLPLGIELTTPTPLLYSQHP